MSDKKAQRTYSGEVIGRGVVGWLNFHEYPEHIVRQFRILEKGFNPRHEQKRVIEILRLYQQSCAEWEDRKREIEWERKNLKQPASVQLRSKKKRASEMLERRLRRYTFYPKFLPFGKMFGKVMSFTWKPTRPDHPDYYGELSAIADLAKLAERDLLDHFKECPCGKWIWARFSHQRFCSAKCRESEFRSSDRWKEHRRQKAREYYRLHKSGKVK